ncbi:hypothetical protein CHU00_17655, partial [Sphingobacterium cellulitidis]|uniref:hypothetical protein n=1 Tax=Sphingobacterium cellulitidis TaxID=1768011 RepID=UPI000B9F90A1
MDQLYTYQILQELKENSFSDNWGMWIGIVFQLIVLWFTIHWSIKLSKEEFNRNISLEKHKEKEELKEIKNLINICLKKEIELGSEARVFFEEILNSKIDDISNLNFAEFYPNHIDTVLRIDILKLNQCLQFYNDQIDGDYN